ncbi:hypothetical protein [Ralstonia solanacearum]|nr:hypothetical protein [Ralstonia solanacearum]
MQLAQSQAGQQIPANQLWMNDAQVLPKKFCYHITSLRRIAQPIEIDIAGYGTDQLFNLLVDVVPLLNRSKADVLAFFRGAGVPEPLTADIAARLRSAPKDVNKYQMVRTVLERLNAKGESALSERCEVLRRVVDVANFDSCWPDDQLKAKGLVASIREVVNQKDAFTRMNNAREEERQARLAETQRIAAEKVQAAQIHKNPYFRPHEGQGKGAP